MQQNINQTAPEQPAGNNMPGQQNQPPKKKKKKRVWLRILIWVVVIAAVIFVTLFLASKIGQFDSIMEMIRWIMNQGVDFSS